MRSSVRLPLSLGVLLALAGCGVTIPQASQPPASLLEDCPHPEVRFSTNGELAEGLLAYREALILCNNDKSALREWAKEGP